MSVNQVSVEAPAVYVAVLNIVANDQMTVYIAVNGASAVTLNDVVNAAMPEILAIADVDSLDYDVTYSVTES